MAKIPPESNPHIKGKEAINEMLDNICNEINIVIEKVYSSPKCLPLEIQALYTINLLTKELIIEAKQPTPSHVEAIIATIKGWGQIRRFGLEPRSGVAIIERILNIPMPDGKTLREYALEASILDLKDDLTILKKTVRGMLDSINYGQTRSTGPAVWKYKMIHLLLSALYPPFDNNIAGGSISVSNYVEYLRYFGQLAERYVSECGSGFERVKGFGYARRLSVDIGVGRVELYLPLTRLLDFVIWSRSISLNKEQRYMNASTLYEYLMNVCTA